MILINVKFPVKPEFADQWPELAREFTETTLAEPGNLWFEWSRSVKEPNTYVLIEAFTDEGAGPARELPALHDDAAGVPAVPRGDAADHLPPDRQRRLGSHGEIEVD